jgi:hypothetical protein
VSRARITAITAITAIAAVALAAACSAGGTTETIDTGPKISVNQTNLLLVAGDSAPLVVNSNREGTVRWRSSNTSVVTVDTVVATGDPAMVRARAAGTAVINGTIVVSGQTYTTSVPVRVGAG